MKEKICNKCKKFFLLTNQYFYKNRYSNNGFSSICKDCIKEYRDREESKNKARGWRIKNKESRAEFSREYYKQNKDKVYLYSQTPKRRFGAYFHGAKARSLEWKLSFEEFMEFWQVPCTYCNSEIKTIGLDRIDNERGYTTDNTISCCGICNEMKMDRSAEEFINHCKKVTKMNI
ncbi:MAG: hypothetical protein AABY22_18930 [Nanoarchaeota archaeon]